MLVKFRSKDTQFGVTRATVKAIAKELDINETQAIHLALSKFASDILPAYEPDDGPLTTKEIKLLRGRSANQLPTGKVLSSKDLFA